MFQKNQKPIRILTIFGISLIIIILFFLQTISNQIYLLFLIAFMMVLYFSAELISTNIGIFLALFTLSLEIFYPLFKKVNQPQNYFLIAALLVTITAYYLLIKHLRNKILETTKTREKFFRTLINLNLQPIILKNDKGEVIFASESIKKLLGLKNNLKIGNNLLEYIHPDDVIIYNNFIKQILTSPDEKKTTEFRIKKADKNWIWVRNDAVNLLDNNEIKSIVTTIQDITFQKELDREKADIIKEEKQARTLAEKAVRDRDQFLSIASHELKTPLTTVLLQLQATLRKISTQSLADFSGNELLNSLQIAEKQSQSLAGLIKDLLNISVASTGKLTLNKERVNLANLVDNLPKKYAEEIKLSGCIVKTIIKDNDISGNWDLVRLDQAVSNIFMNALKYAKGKKVTLIADKEEGWGLIKIKDEGNGIEDEYLNEIFEPFKKAGTNTNTSGLGVGLFIARQIAIAHKGNISVESKVGKGSTFTLKLPL